MTSIKWQEEKITLRDLLLWDQNARFTDKYFSKPEKELIEHFCSDKKFKIETFAKEIVQDFDLPQLEKFVVWDSGENKIVIEGNRRLTVYKLLNNPELAPTDELKEKFSSLKETITIHDDTSFDCVITSLQTEALRYVDRKHNNWNNEVPWVETERTNYRIRRGNATKKQEFKSAIEKFVRKLELPEDIVDQIFGKWYVTTFWRIIEGSVKLFGLTVDEKKNIKSTDIDFEKKLKVIIWNVLQKKDFSGNKIDSRSLNTNNEKESYIRSINNTHYEKFDKEINKNTVSNIFGESTVRATRNTQPLARKTSTIESDDILFGRKLILKKGSINNLYCALDDIYEKFKNDKKIEHKLPIVGMSLRLLLDVAGREICGTDNDKSYKDFLKKAREEMELWKESENFLALTNNWLSGDENLEGVFGKYAHWTIPSEKWNILKLSKIVWDILEFYFK